MKIIHACMSSSLAWVQETPDSDGDSAYSDTIVNGATASHLQFLTTALIPDISPDLAPLIISFLENLSGVVSDSVTIDPLTGFFSCRHVPALSAQSISTLLNDRFGISLQQISSSVVGKSVDQRIDEIRITLDHALSSDPTQNSLIVSTFYLNHPFNAHDTEQFSLCISSVSGISHVSLSSGSRKCHIMHDPTKIRVRGILDEMEKLGFTCRYQPPKNVFHAAERLDTKMRQDIRRTVIMLLVCFLLTIIVIAVSLIYDAASMDNPIKQMLIKPVVSEFTRYTAIQASLTGILAFGFAFPFHKHAWLSLFHLVVVPELLLSIAILSSYTTSLILDLTLESLLENNTGQSKAVSVDFFTTCAVLVTAAWLGRWIELFGRYKSARSVHQFSKFKSLDAILMSSPNYETDEKVVEEKTINAFLLEVGDIVRVGPDGIIPCDGEIIQGSSDISMSHTSFYANDIYRRVRFVRGCFTYFERFR